MIGLEEILRIWGMQHQELATKLGIKKQNINLWVTGKQAISKKYLPVLAEMFGVSEDVFQRELTDIEKLYIQKAKIEKEAEEIEYECTDPYTGETYLHRESTLDITQYLHKVYEIKREELIKQIKNRLVYIIDKSIEEQEQNNGFVSMENAISEATSKVEFFQKLIRLDSKVDHNIYFKVIRALSIAFGKGFDSDPFVRKLTKIIKDEIEAKEKERQEHLKLYNEIWGKPSPMDE